MKTVALHTLGCKVNYAETSTIGRQFVEQGFNVVDPAQASDVYVLNTCSVTERADKECRQIIRRFLRQSPSAYIIVVGCYAQLQPGEIMSIDGVDLVLGAKEKFNIFSHAGNFDKTGTPQSYVSCIDEVDEFFTSYSGDVEGRTRAFLKVQDGCDYSCTFCTIPLARGGSRSQPIENLIKEANEIVALGFKEIVLTGVNVGDYGKKIGSNLFDLMKALESVRGLERIRISSIEPNLLTKEMIDFVVASGKFCNHFHIPMQSGSDTILKSMRRRYLTQNYRELIEYIKSVDANAAIGADVLVGFPDETPKLFEETATFISELPITYLHVFTYSERENTDAVELNGAIPIHIRKDRNEVLQLTSSRKRREFYASSLNTVQEVLFEGVGKNGSISGLTTNYLRIEVPADQAEQNDIKFVRINKVHDAHAEGTILPINEFDLNKSVMIQPSGAEQYVQI